MKRHLGSLTGWKVLALVIVFWVHAWQPKVDGAVGAVIMNYFFCCSGFLVALRYWNDASFSGLAAGLRYLRRKIVQIWPVYFLGILLFLLGTSSKKMSDPHLWCDVACNLLMVQSWGTGMERLQFAINGATWFLSSIVFCYFMAPILMSLFRRVRSRVLPFVAMALAMLAIEELRRHFPGEYFELDLYTNPFFRSLEFGCAMCAFPLFDRLSSKLERARGTPSLLVGATVAEVAVIAAWVVAWHTSLRTLPVAVVMCLSIASVLVFAVDAGLLSKLLGSRIFRILAAVELEFYVLHQAAIAVAHKHFFHDSMFSMEFAARWLPWAALAFTFALAIVYRRWCASRASKGMDAALTWLSGKVLRKS